MYDENLQVSLKTQLWLQNNKIKKEITFIFSYGFSTVNKFLAPFKN